MKTIQWFPGHMTKAMREMEKKRDLCDGVICVLDARAPIATVNKNLKKKRRGIVLCVSLYIFIKSLRFGKVFSAKHLTFFF